VDLDFQREVWNSILLVTYEMDATSRLGTLKIQANVVYTYDIFVMKMTNIYSKNCYF